MTTSRPIAFRLAWIWAVSLMAAGPASSLIARCSGGTDLPSSSFFAASGSPVGVSPRSGATYPGTSDGITESANEPASSPPKMVSMPCRSMAQRDRMADIGVLELLRIHHDVVDA